MLALAVVALAISTYSTGLARASSELLGQNRVLALINGLFNPFRTQHLLLNSGLPVYDLSITRAEYLKIERAVEQARRRGWMDDELKVWARARFFHEGREHDVKVRVRGDLSPHWEGAKKSWRIKFGHRLFEQDGEVIREADYFEGRRQINLIIPRDRDFILSYFTNSLLRDDGLVTPRDGFAVLRINGAVQGLYYEVEHFDKPLLAAHRRPETAVFAQSDRAMHFEQYTKYGAIGASDARFDIGSVRRLVETESELGSRAMQVLLDHSLDPTAENFRAARSVLDWDRYLSFRVLTTLFNTNHVRFGSDNLRLYYDPSRGLLEPVPWDVHLTRLPIEPGTIDFWNSKGPDELQRATLLDPSLRLERNQKLWELVSDGGEALLKRYDEIHDWIRPLAWADVLSTPIQGHKMDERRSDLAFNLRRVHKVLSLSSAHVSYRLETDERASIDFTSTNFSGLQIESLRIESPDVLEGEYRLYLDANEDGILDPGDPLLVEAASDAGKLHLPLHEIVLPRLRYGSDEVGGRYWEYFDTLSGRTRFFLEGRLAQERRTDPLSWRSPAIEVVASNPVTGLPIPSVQAEADASPAVDSVAVTAFDARAPFDLAAAQLDLAGFLAAHPEFEASPGFEGAAELAGAVEIESTVIVPREVPLVLAPGVEVSMAPGASLLAYGGLVADGTPTLPIRIHGSKPDEPWGVLAVVRPPHEVVARHIEVRGASQAVLNGILFTGGFAVHEGDLRLEHCRFVDMRSEDGVNLKNGRIAMRDCSITGGASDGMDLDFVTGEVRDSVFANNGGDGLDLSGSEILVAGNHFESMGDKAISVGENSHPIIVNNLIRGNAIGISSKDLSFARVAYSTFLGNRLAIEAKRKKPMFGGAGGEFVNNVYVNNDELLSEDFFSRGGIQIYSSLLDRDSLPCQGCSTGEVHFAAGERGDFRLASTPDAAGFVAAAPSWVKLEDEPGADPPSVPGVFGAPLPGSWERQ
jgi:hypothetical protein